MFIESPPMNSNQTKPRRRGLRCNILFVGYHPTRIDNVTMNKKCILIAALVFTCGCTDAFQSQISSYGSKHHIELWSGGQKVKEWTSTGKVLSEETSDGYYFCDKETGKLVRVTGDLVITPIE